MKKLMMLLLCLMLAACTAKEDKNTAIQAISYTDALDRVVNIPTEPERVAALLGSYADLWMLAGGEVCATVDDAWDDLQLDLSEDVINLGGTKSPSLELLLASDPDLVLASASTAADVEMLETLESARIPVVYLEVDTFEDYLAALKLCTDITGRDDLYAKNGEQIRGPIEEMKAAYKASGQKVLFLRASAGYIRAKNSEGSILGEMLAELGCRNIADDDMMLLENLSIESILKQDPDHIFIVQSGDDPEGTVENVNTMMEENPAWKDLTAVKEGRVHYLDKHLFNLKPNARWAEAYEQLIELLQE